MFVRIPFVAAHLIFLDTGIMAVLSDFPKV
jgi:hypothetical protein